MLKARLVLEDCRHAWEKLEIESDKQQYRILWVAGVALCRAVGHVLHKVDTKRHPEISSLVNMKFNQWKLDTVNPIFTDFIENERNLVLKQYEIGYDDSSLDIHTCKNIYDIKDIFACTISDGYYAGKSACEVLHEAVTWWEEQLDDIVKYIK